MIQADTFPEGTQVNCLDRAREVLDIEIEALQKVRGSLDASFEEAVSVILDCLRQNGKIVLTGIGKSLHIADKISATLASTGSTSVVLHPVQAVHGDLGIVTARDVLIAISYSGESDELLTLLPIVKRLNVKIVSITASRDNSLAKLSDVVIVAAVEREACPFNMAPTASTTTALAVGDALAMVLLEAQGFRKEDYARLHPGGAIGRALLLRVADILRPPDRVAKISAEAPVRDALVEMTRARAGSCAVVDDLDRVVGIFTDGDLRRHLSRRHVILDEPVKTVMTANPVTVRPEQLAVDVLAVFEKNNIDDLIVVDAQKKFIGLIDIQDLPKLKIL